MYGFCVGAAVASAVMAWIAESAGTSNPHGPFILMGFGVVAALLAIATRPKEGTND